MPESAVEFARKAVELDRRNVEYLNTLGVAYMEAGQVCEAEKTLRRALHVRPVYPDGMFNLGQVLEKKGALADGQRAYERALAMGGKFPELHGALAQVYRRQGRLDRALAILDESMHKAELAPLMAECLAEARGFDHGLQWLRQALARHPGSARIRAKLAYMLLSAGQWREGWKLYTWRYQAPDEIDLQHAVLPENLDGMRVRLLGEQGIGDVLFLLRYLPQLAARGATTDLVCGAKLAALLKEDRRFGSVSTPEEEADAGFDYRLYLGDLPAVLDVDRCAPVFPLAADVTGRRRCVERLSALGAPPYLGVTWRAGAETSRYEAAPIKHVPIAELGQTLRGWRGTLVTLQRDPAKDDLAAIRSATGAAVHDLSALNDDLPEMLALLDVLDEYVAVSNTNIHLRAGLGRTARVLVPYPPEWRWMRKGRSDWFPSFPVYREPAPRGWSQLLAQLRAELFP